MGGRAEARDAGLAEEKLLVVTKQVVDRHLDEFNIHFWAVSITLALTVVLITLVRSARSKFPFMIS